MTSKRAWVGDVYCVRWIAPDLDDVDAILSEVREGASERAGQAHYMAFIGEGTSLPTAEVRQAMKGTVEHLLREVRSVHIVVEGKGFRRAALRSINTAVFLASRHRDRAFAHDTAEGGAEALARWDVPKGPLLRGLEDEGLLAGPG